MWFKKKRIALALNSMVVFGGVETHAMQFATHMRDQGYDVTLLVLRKMGKVAEEFEKRGFRIIYVPVYSYDDAVHLNKAQFLKLAWILWRERFRTIYATNSESGIFVRAAAFLPLGRRLIAMTRIDVKAASPKMRRINKLFSLWTHRIICNSDYTRDTYMQFFDVAPSKVDVVEEGASIVPPKDPQENLRKRLAGYFVFGSVGNLEARKRHDIEIRALARLRDLGVTDCALVILGEGDEEPRLRALVSELNIADRVFFMGSQSNPHDFYPLFNVFVFASVREGFGIVWAEAMLHNLPVISSEVRPMSDYIKDRVTGLTFPADDPNKFALAMKELKENPELRAKLIRAGREMVEQRFTHEIVLSKLSRYAE